MDAERFRPRSIATLNLLCGETDLKIIGYVLMIRGFSTYWSGPSKVDVPVKADFRARITREPAQIPRVVRVRPAFAGCATIGGQAEDQPQPRVDGIGDSAS